LVWPDNDPGERYLFPEEGLLSSEKGITEQEAPLTDSYQLLCQNSAKIQNGEMKKIIWHIILVLLILHPSELFSNDGKKADALFIKAKSALLAINKNPDSVYREAMILQREARSLENHEAELCALNCICSYFEKKYDFKNMITSAENLYKAADQYNFPAYKAISKDILFRAYSFNGLNKEAFEQLEQGLTILKTADAGDSLVIEARSNLYISLSNYYLMQNDSGKRLKYIRLSMAEHNKFKNSIYRKKLEYIDFANLATVYKELNSDSAEIYALKSIAADKQYGLNNIRFSNFLVLGIIKQQQKDFAQAKYYYKEAEKISDYKNHINIEILYENLIDLYKSTGDTENEKKYEQLLEKLKLRVSESKNQSLYKILEDNEAIEKKHFQWYLILSGVILVPGILVFILLFARQKRIVSHQEMMSRNYLLEQDNEPKSHSYSRLIQMIKDNDLSFYNSFLEVHPDFSAKLFSINPKIVKSELEFCAMLKLNLSTKDIARYRNIEPRTVQNKKYLIRKKLNIPGDMDIYYWFSNL